MPEKLDQPFKIERLERDLLEQTPREDHFFKGDATLSALFRLYKPITESYTKASAEEEERICFAISRTNNPPIQVDGSELGIRASNNRELINEYVRKLTPTSYSKLFEAITVHSSKGLEADAIIFAAQTIPYNSSEIYFLAIFWRYTRKSSSRRAQVILRRMLTR